MVNRVERSSHRTWIGILLVVIGFLFLMDTLDFLHVGRVFGDWWPLILIVIGLTKLRGYDKTGGAFLFVLGIAFLSASLDIINWGSILRFWPLILIAIGISMVMKARTWTESEKTGTKVHCRCTVAFGGVEIRN